MIAGRENPDVELAFSQLADPVGEELAAAVDGFEALGKAGGQSASGSLDRTGQCWCGKRVAGSQDKPDLSTSRRFMERPFEYRRLEEGGYAKATPTGGELTPGSVDF